MWASRLGHVLRCSTGQGQGAAPCTTRRDLPARAPPVSPPLGAGTRRGKNRGRGGAWGGARATIAASVAGKKHAEKSAEEDGSSLTALLGLTSYEDHLKKVRARAFVHHDPTPFALHLTMR